MEAPEGVIQRREFRLLGVERETITMNMLHWFKKPWKIGNKRGTLTGKEANENITTPCVLSCAWHA